MAPEVSVDMKRRVVHWYLIDGLNYREISQLSGCSIGLISKVMRNQREFGEVNNPFSTRTGRPSAIEEGDIVYLQSLLEANPALYLDELQSRLLSV